MTEYKSKQEKRSEHKRRVVRELRGLASPSAEVLSDYVRLNRLVIVAMEAAALLDDEQ